MSAVFCPARVYLDEIAEILSCPPNVYGFKTLKELFFDLKLEQTSSLYSVEIEQLRKQFEYYCKETFNIGMNDRNN